MTTTKLLPNPVNLRAPGDRVTIYEDPMSGHMPEGNATLVRRTATASRCGWIHGSPIERWDVQFDDDTPGDTVERTIVFPPCAAGAGQ